MRRYIDAHIHLDAYEEGARQSFMERLSADGIDGVVAVSTTLASCKATRELAQRFPGRVYPAYGYHPERPLPSDQELRELLEWMDLHKSGMTAVGEVGLPYYTRTEAEARGDRFDISPYVDLLEQFVRLAAEWDKPIVLHAVYEDADIACGLLEKYNVRRAHFHWFKGSAATVERMSRNGYFVSFTPDILYEQEIEQLARVYPLEQIMAETDGPWPFEGPFRGQMTEPRMVAAVAGKLAEIKNLGAETVAETFLHNTRAFYRLQPAG